MKRSLMCALVLFALALGSHTAHAQLRFNMNAGVVMPTRTAQAYPGYQINGILMYRLKNNKRVEVGSRFGYTSFDYDVSSPTVASATTRETRTIYEVSPMARYYFVDPNPKFNTFAQAGIGYYNYSSSQAGFETQHNYGFNVGAGVNGNAGGLKYFLMPTYNIMMLDHGGSIGFFAFNIGVAI